MTAESIYPKLIRLFVAGKITADEFVESYLELGNIMQWFRAFNQYSSEHSEALYIAQQLFPEVRAYPGELWSRKETYLVTADKLLETARQVLSKLDELQKETNS